MVCYDKGDRAGFRNHVQLRKYAHTHSYKQIWCLYTSIVPKGKRRPRNGKEQTGSGAGSKSGADRKTRDRTGDCGGEASVRKETQKSCGRNVENGGDLG